MPANPVIKAIFLTLSSKKSVGEIINIGSGKPQKIINIIKTIQKIIGKGQPQYGKIKYRKEESMRVYPDIRKAKNIIKWKPTINFNRGIRIVINSFS